VRSCASWVVLGLVGCGWLLDPGMSEKLDFSVNFFAVIMTVSTMMMVARDVAIPGQMMSAEMCLTYKQSDPLSNRANIEEKLHSLDYCKLG
jgi:hypothetical protein